MSSARRDVISVLTSSTLVRVVGFASSVLTRRLLGPEPVGVWNFIQVLQQQLTGTTLGVHYAAEREIPMRRAGGDADGEDRVRSLAFTWLVAEGLLIGLGTLAYAWWAWSRTAPAIRIGLLLVPLLVLGGRVTLFYQMALKAGKAFTLFSGTTAALTLINAAMIAYVLAWGVRGVYIGLAANALLIMLMYWLVVRRTGLFRLHWRLSWAELRPLLRYSIGMGLWGVLYSLLFRVDAFMISASLGPGALGLYYLGPQLAAMASEIPTAIGVVAFPRLLERAASDGLGALRSHLAPFAAAVVFLATPPVVAAAWFGTGVLVRHVLPDFVAGLPAIQTALLVVLPWVPAMLFGQVLLAAGRVGTLISITAGTLTALAAALSVPGDALTIVYAARATVVAQYGYFALVLLAAAATTGGVMDRPWSSWLRYWVSTLVSAAVIVGVASLVERPGLGLVPDLLRAAAGTALVTLATAALATGFERGLLGEAIATLRRRR